MKTDSEIVMILSQNTQAKDCLRLPNIGRGREDHPLEAAEQVYEALPIL